MTLLSFVIPCYRSEKTIEKVIDEIIATVAQREGYDYEVIAVNDSSPDNVYEVLKRIAAANKKVKVINFAKNMGKHAAVLAGYSVARGKYIVNLDDDYQCPTYALWSLLEPVERDECDYATAKYSFKQETWYKRLGSNVNVWMGHVMLDKPMSLRLENFSVMKAFVAREVIGYKNPYPYLEGLILRVTRRILAVPMEERERGDDNATGFTLKKSMSLLMNGLTAFSVKPLRVASLCGTLFAIMGFILGIVMVVRKLVNPAVPTGYSSIVAILLFSSGLIMLMLGLIGEYLGRMYICLNGSPQYVIRETINLGEEE